MRDEMERRRFLTLLLGGLLVPIGSRPVLGRLPGERPRTALRIAAASSLKFALERIIRTFETENESIGISTSYGASGAIYAQLRHGAPFDLFLSADTLYPKRLIEGGYALGDHPFVYAQGRLCLWVSNSITAKSDHGPSLQALSERLNHEDRSPHAEATKMPDWGDLLDTRIQRIAIANPKLAPYGVAAVESLKKAGIYDEVENRLAYGESVAQAVSFVRSGAAQAGLFALALALSPGMNKRGAFREIDASYFSPILHSGVILKRTQAPEAALRFLAWMRGPRGQDLIEEGGFGPVRETP